MQLRRIAAMSAVILTSSTVTSAVTHADTSSPTTLYVNNAVGCSTGTGAGTQALPFCAIQDAVNAATVPGDTVVVATGTYAPFTVTASGTSTAPITIKGTKQTNQNGGILATTSINASNAVAITVSGASYVNIDTIQVYEYAAEGGVAVSNSSHITLDSDGVQQFHEHSVGAAVAISGGSSNVTVSRAWVTAYADGGGVVATGGSGDIITTSLVNDWDGAAVVLAGAPSSDVTSNQINIACGTAISVTAGSSAASVQNNVAVPGGFTSAPNFECSYAPAAERVLVVDTSSTSGTTADYNDFAVLPVTVPDIYSWAGADYATPAAFTSGATQGAHDVGSTSTAYAIDSANSAAPGELSTDINGRPRVDDPLIPNSGAGPFTYYDRGPSEIQEPLRPLQYSVSASQAPTGGTVTFTAKSASTWSGTLTYTFVFGDGSTKTNTTGVATYSYTTTGSYTTSVTVTGSSGATLSVTSPITIVAPTPLAATLTLTPVGSQSVVASAQGSDGWNITGYAFDFGDSTLQQPGGAGTSSGPVTHNYSGLGSHPITVTVYDSNGSSTKVTQNFTTAGSRYTAYGPARVLDTRHGVGTGGVIAKLGANQALSLKIGGNGTIPANASAVAFNLTVTNPSAGGYLAAYPHLQSKPATSNLNFIRAQTKATNVLVGVGTDGYVSLYNGSPGTVDLIADVTGYFTQANADGYTPLSPARILDTRNGTGIGGVKAQIGAGKALPLTIAGADSGALPSNGITAVALNLTAVDEATGGYLTAYPDASTRPLASSLNFDAGHVVPNTVIVPVGADGKIDLYNGSGGPIDLIADVQGYFTANGPDAYVPVAPSRLYDSGTPFGNTAVVQPLGSAPGISYPNADTAFVYNVTVTQAFGTGYVTVYPNGQSAPPTSNVNFTNGETTSNTAIAQGGATDGADVAVFTFAGPAGAGARLLMDFFGYFSAQ